MVSVAQLWRVIVATLPNLKIVDKGGARSETAATGTLVACPFCAEMIKAEAIVCRYCGRDQTSVAASVRTQSGQIPTLSVKDTSRPTSDFSQESEPSRSVVSEPDIGKQQTNSTEPDSDRPRRIIRAECFEFPMAVGGRRQLLWEFLC